MSVLSVQSPYPIFTDTDGDPLENGFIWIGVAGLDPQVNPIAVYWDAALTMPAVQPIRTLAGYPSQAGSPGRIYTSADHSVRVMNKRGTIVFTAGNVRDRFSADLIGYVGPDGLDYTVQDMANASNVAFGDALIAVKGTLSGGLNRTQHNKNEDKICARDYCVANGLTDDTVKFQAIVDSGRDIYLEGGIYLLGQISCADDGQQIIGPGEIISAGINHHQFNITANNVKISNIKFTGIATVGNVYFAINGASSQTGLQVMDCLFTGSNANSGWSNGVKFNDGCSYSGVYNCMFQRLIGNASGQGYGVLSGDCDAIVTDACHFVGSSGKGRHGVYYSSGGSNSIISNCTITGFDYSGISIDARLAQPTNTDIVIANNLITYCARVNTFNGGGIDVYGKSKNLRIIGNTIRLNYGCGIILNSITYDLHDTIITCNHIDLNGYVGIDVTGALRGAINGNILLNNSAASPGTFPNIRLIANAGIGSDNWTITGNQSSGVTNARSAFQINSTAPLPVGTILSGNYFPVCNSTDLEFNGAVVNLNGKLFSLQSWDVPNLLAATSASQNFTVAGADGNDAVTVTFSNALSAGVLFYGFVSAANTVTVTAFNSTAAPIDLAASTLIIQVWKK